MNIKLLPKKPGVYLMRSLGGEIIYIGKASNLFKRVAQYFQSSKHGYKISSMLAVLKKIDYIQCASERDALILEKKLIKKYQPFFNVDLKDDKSYLYVKLTINEDFPRLTATRKKLNDGALYFGPYPKASAVKSLLKYLWKSKLIALRPCKWEFSIKKPLAQRKINSCIYYHTKQCLAPCAGEISYKDYRKLAKRAVLFFSGRFKKLSREFYFLMKKASKNMNYEQAGVYKNCISALSHMSEKIVVAEYKEKEIFKLLNMWSALSNLAQIIGLKSAPEHIEVFDTSSLFGREAVGSMVCFMVGEKNFSHYRRFKIKNLQPKRGSDDILMIWEIVKRRLLAIKNLGETLPDLLLIDGGMSQLASAVRAVSELKLKVPVISLAKKHEEIFAQGKRAGIKLSKSDEALKLLMRMRDEAHRFAILYHKKLRSKKIFQPDVIK